MISEEGGASRAGAYNPVRGDKVIEFSKKFLDENFAIIDASFDDVNSFVVSDGLLQIGLTNGTRTSLKNNDQFLGFQGSAKEPSGILLKNNNLHAEIQIDASHPVGSTDPAGNQRYFA
jgi:malate synthase